MLGYRTIRVPCEDVETHRPALESFFAQYPEKDVRFDITDGHLLVFLRQLDVQRFEKDVQALAEAGQCPAPLSKALALILKIRSYGLRGSKRIYVDYNRERKVKNRRLKVQTRKAYFYAIGHRFSQTNNDAPPDLVNHVIVGDSEIVLRDLPDNCVDLIFTSPPYNFGLDYESHVDGTDWRAYLGKLFKVLTECIRVLKYGGRLAINVQPLFSDYIPLHHIISHFLMRKKLIWRGEIIWDKHNWNCKYTAWGSWASPASPYLKYTWEFIEVFCKGELRKPGKKEDTDITPDEFKKYVIAKWDIAPERSMKEYDHPAMFPEQLAERVIKLFSYKNDVVLDPFNGVGTTTAVAHRLGRRYIGIDISPEYCQKAIARLAAPLQPALL